MYILFENTVIKSITCTWFAAFISRQNAAAVSGWGHRQYEFKSKEKQSWISKAEFHKNQYFIMEGARVMDGSKWKYSSGGGSSMWGSDFVPAEWKINDWCCWGTHTSCTNLFRLQEAPLFLLLLCSLTLLTPINNNESSVDLLHQNVQYFQMELVQAWLVTGNDEAHCLHVAGRCSLMVIC